MMKWSEEAWAAAAPVYDSIIHHPFVTSLADGSLDRECFLYYLSQDARYLETYSRVLAHIASRLTDRGEIDAFLKFASDGIAVERALHESFLPVGASAVEKSPACLLYTSVLKSQAYEPVEVEAAAVLPCFWIYQRVGSHISGLAAEDNPYRRWIDTYGDPSFEAATERAIGLCDAMAGRVSPDVRGRMTEVFVLCARMEWMFWQSAWKLEKWEI